ncbi:MAG: hypothetical protein ACK558_13430, partial [Pseudomonadota bacterium]
MALGPLDRKPGTSGTGLWVSSSRLDQQMVMTAHQAPRPDPPVEAARHPAEVGHEGRAIHVVDKDRLARIPARHHMIERTVELEAERAGHERTLVEPDARNK